MCYVGNFFEGWQLDSMLHREYFVAVFWLLENEHINLDIENPLQKMKLLLNIHFPVHCIIAFDCVLKSLLHHCRFLFLAILLRTH